MRAWTRTPFRPGPFHSNAGPRDGPTLARDRRPSMGIFADPAEPIPVGVAQGAGSSPDPSDPDRPVWATFRLVVSKDPLPGV